MDKIFQRRLGLLPSARASSIIAIGAIMYSTGEDMPGGLARQLADVAEQRTGTEDGRVKDLGDGSGKLLRGGGVDTQLPKVLR